MAGESLVEVRSVKLFLGRVEKMFQVLHASLRSGFGAVCCVFTRTILEIVLKTIWHFTIIAPAAKRIGLAFLAYHSRREQYRALILNCLNVLADREKLAEALKSLLFGFRMAFGFSGISLKKSLRLLVVDSQCKSEVY